VELRLDPIPDGSYRIRGWVKDRGFGDPIDLTGILAHIDDDTAEVQSAHGRMPVDLQLLLGMKAHALGYRWLIFEVIEGSKVTRFADYIETKDGFDRYRVDLPRRIADALSAGDNGAD
jgi:hypothetical protein